MFFEQRSEVTLVKTPICFSGDSWLQLSDGRRQNIEQLQSGENLLAFDGSNVVASEIMFILDKNAYAQALFYTLETASNHTISLSAEHLIPVVSEKGISIYIPVERIKAGHHSLYVLSDDGILSQSLVIRVSIQMKIGYFAPLTTSETVLVNNVVASCFSHVHNIAMAQLSMTPVRWYYKVARYFGFMKHFDSRNDILSQNGLHWIPQIMFNLV
ncbi:unnamed protein product [Rotaria sordida]|uniref:Hint domain-containing protein n=1 Tax=Rotaria sordida TaxID=392033 RepID=A0A814FTT5_9BILA|nr:unnamed protein product [Rotaria sordida]